MRSRKYQRNTVAAWALFILLMLGYIVVMLGIAVGITALIAWLFMWLWNAAIVPWLAWPRMNFFVAVAVVVLLSLAGNILRGGVRGNDNAV
jgi:hypothetical protein